MELIIICRRLAQTRRGAIKKVNGVKKGLEKFLVKMLDLCRPHRDPDKCEITLCLSKGAYTCDVRGWWREGGGLQKSRSII